MSGLIMGRAMLPTFSFSLPQGSECRCGGKGGWAREGEDQRAAGEEGPGTWRLGGAQPWYQLGFARERSVTRSVLSATTLMLSHVNVVIFVTTYHLLQHFLGHRACQRHRGSLVALGVGGAHTLL